MTREEIIEGLKLLEDNMVYFDELLNDKGEYIDVHELLFEAIEALQQEPKTGRWIPVSERLPENNGVYIVSRWFSDGEESAILTDANYYDGCGEWYNDNRINWGRKLVTDKIVAWMPLPEPYKAESEDKE